MRFAAGKVGDRKRDCHCHGPLALAVICVEAVFGTICAVSDLIGYV